MNTLHSLIVAGSSLLMLTTNCGAFAKETATATTPQTTQRAVINKIVQEYQTKSSEHEMLDEIYTALFAGDFAAALAISNKLISDHPNCAEAYCLRGQINLYYKEDPNPDLDQIEADFNKALALEPNNIDALWGRVDVSTERKNWTAAEADLLAIRTLHPESETVMCELIYVHRNMNRLDKVMQDFDYWLGFAPNDPLVYEDRAGFHVKMGNADLALADLEKAYQLYVAQGNEEEASRVKQQIASAKQGGGSAG